MAAHPTLWLHDDFDITSILPKVRWKLLKNSPQYVQTLLDDDSLRRSLRQNTSWKFSRTEHLLAMLEKEPSLFDNTQALTLDNFEYFPHDGFPSAIGRSGVFSRLTSLSFRPSYRCTKINLDEIVELCPLLENLTFSKLSNFQGSLAGLRNLKSLDLGLGIIQKLVSSLIPIDSAKTLTRLSIYPCGTFLHGGTLDPNINPFEPFTRLTDLTIPAYPPTLLELLSTTKIPLSRLKIDLSGHRELRGHHERQSDAAFLHLMAAPIVGRLESLTFQYEDYPDTFIPMWAPSDFECLTYLEFAFDNLPSWEGSRFQFLGVLIDVEELDKKKDIIRKEIIEALKSSCGFGFVNREIQFRVVARDHRCTFKTGERATIDVCF